MSRAEEVVNQVRRAFDRVSQGLAVEVPDVVRAYGAKVDEVNARLDRCVALLRRGLRSEAIHLAEMAPPVLDEAAALEFPQRDAFELWCADNSLECPQLNVAAVEELNSAYSREQRLEQLLKWHRRLAIGRGPLKARIRILRKLSAADVQNPVWGEDLVQFERVRHRQLAKEAESAWKRRDHAGMAALHKECCVEPWLEPPPDALTRSVRQFHSDLAREHLKRRLESLAQSVDLAYQQQDANRVRSLLEEWHKLADSLDDDKESLLTPSIADASQWLEDRQRQESSDAEFERACRSLELALDDNHPLDDLEKLWAVFGRMERPAPRALQQRLQSRVKEQKLLQLRRHRVRLVAVVCVTLLLASLVGVVLYLQAKESRVDSWVAQIQPLVDESRWGEAQTLLDRVKAEEPESWEAATIQSLAVKVNEGISIESQRRDRFLAAMERAKTAGAMRPDMEAVKVARELAVSDEERLEVESFEGQIQAAARLEQEGRDQEFVAALDSIRERFGELRDNADLSDQAKEAAYRGLQKQLSDLMSSNGISATVLSSGQAMGVTLASSLSALNEKMTRDSDLATKIANIRSSYRQPKAYAAAISAFTSAYPSHPMSADLRKASDVVPGWESVALCSPLLQKIANAQVKTIEDVKGLVPAFDDLQKQPVSVYRQAIDDYVEYLKTASRALDPVLMTDRARGDLDDLLSNPLIEGLKIIRLKSGKLYYTHANNARPEPRFGIVNLRVVLSLDEAFGVEPVEVLNMPAENVDLATYPMNSPQLNFAMAARQFVKAKRGEWETFHVRLAELLHAHADIDPVLRAGIMARVIGWASERDWPKHPELGQWVRQLQSIRTDVDWVDSSNADAERERKAADEVLKAAPDWAKLKAATVSWQRRIEEDLAVRIPIGIVWLKDNLKTVELDVAVPLNGRMEVVLKLADGSFGFEPIGTLADGEPKWLQAAESQPAGTVVYLVAE